MTNKKVKWEIDEIEAVMEEVYEQRTKQLDSIRGDDERPFVVAGMNLIYNYYGAVLSTLKELSVKKGARLKYWSCEVKSKK